MIKGTSILRYFHPAILARALGKKPVTIKIGDESIVLFRTMDGKPAAVKDRCPHRFTPLSAGHVNAEGRITCPYHGWSFDGQGEGRKPGDAGRCRVQAYQVVEKYNLLWVGDARASQSQIPDFPEDEWAFLESYGMRFKAPLHVVVDNFSEDEHFPYVHTRFGWDDSRLDEVEYSSKVVGNEVHVYYWGPQRDFFGMKFLGTKPGQYFENSWVQSYDPMRITYTGRLTDKRKNTVSAGDNRTVIYFVPIGNRETHLHVIQFVNFRKKFWYLALPWVKPMFQWLIKSDLRNDAVLTAKLTEVPYSLKGMALGKYDDPIKWNRELLEKVYFGSSS